MNIKYLVSFLTVAEERSINTAASRLFISPSALMKQVNSLDMRRNRLYVTPEGIESLECFENRMSDYNEKIFEGFTEEELKQLESFSERVNENLEKLMKEE